MKIGIYNNQIITEMFFDKIGIDNITNIQDVDDKYPQMQKGLYEYPLICIEDLDINGKFNENLYNERQVKEKNFYENQPLIIKIKTRLTELSEDIVQDQVGEKVPSINERKNEFIQLHNQLRELEGKIPRELKQ